MPGYRHVPEGVVGAAADEARNADRLARDGNLLGATAGLEQALELSQADHAVLPGWLCGRLATLYRTLERYQDEVDLLERYQASQVSEDARSRYSARLSKARSIVQKRTKHSNGALLSIRASLEARRPSKHVAAD